MDKGLGKRLKAARLDRGFTADKLSELCNINATYLRQIEGGKKIPSLPVFIDLCNVLRVSPDYLLRDVLVSNEISHIEELTKLWENAAPGQQEIASTMVKAVLEYLTKTN